MSGVDPDDAAGPPPAPPPTSETDKEWFKDEATKLRQEAERLRVRAAAFADDARVREARAFAEKTNVEARKTVREATNTLDNVLQEASALTSTLSSQIDKSKKSAEATLAAQSPETVALLARDTVTDTIKSSQADIQKWQADVTSSVEDRIFDELEVFVKELEPSLRESGRRATLSALGIVGRRSSPFVRSKEANEARKQGNTETTRRFELFEQRLIQPVLIPFKKGMFEPVMEKAHFIGLGFLGYSVACGALGAYIARKGNNRGEGGGGASPGR